MPENPDRFRYANVELLKAISGITGKPFLVDSSKTRRRLRRYQQCSDIDLKVVHLLRHPLGVAASSKRKGANGLKPIRVLRGWRIHNEKLCKLLKEQPRQVSLLRLRHEDFATDPEKWLRVIADWMGLTFERSQLEYYETPHHIPSGNRLRLSLAEGRAISLDTGWISRVTLGERIYLWLTARHFLTNLGYKCVISNEGDFVVPWPSSDEGAPQTIGTA
ncbi:MAG: sulfotransferase [Verrucomicrobia bacterium]|nr:sulfotransferase [Verrucomicrobiota bacterium]